MNKQTMECYFDKFCYSNIAEEISEPSLLEPNSLRLFQKTINCFIMLKILVFFSAHGTLIDLINHEQPSLSTILQT